MTPDTRACLRAMAVVRRWLTAEMRYGDFIRFSTVKACIEALHPTRNPRLKAALQPLTAKRRKRKAGDAME